MTLLRGSVLGLIAVVVTTLFLMGNGMAERANYLDAKDTPEVMRDKISLAILGQAVTDLEARLIDIGAYDVFTDRSDDPSEPAPIATIFTLKSETLFNPRVQILLAVTPQDTVAEIAALKVFPK